MENSFQKIIDATAPLNARYEELGTLIASPEIIADNKLYQRLVLERAGLEEAALCRAELSRCLKTSEKYRGELEKSSGELRALILDELGKLGNDCQTLAATLTELIRPEAVESGVLLELRVDSGGEPAARFCAALAAMYRGMTNSKGWTLSVENESETASGGLKNAAYLIIGFGVWDSLSQETGIHKAVGLDDGRNKNASGAVVVTALRYTPYVAPVLDEKDVRIDLYHSGGAGGQNINKVETAVRLTHLPTGTVVTCQDERSQLKNKERAYAALLERLEESSRKQNEEALRKERKAKQDEAKRKDKIRVYDFLSGKATDIETGVSVPLSEWIKI